jgi:hypothetical protein
MFRDVKMGINIRFSKKRQPSNPEYYEGSLGKI